MFGTASGAAGGKPRTAPNCSPPKYQSSTAASAHTAAEMKNTFGRGKNELNMAFLFGESLLQSGCGKAGAGAIAIVTAR
jgi:hypothetical protein